MHAGIAAGVGRAFSHVCLSVCLSVCPCSNRKTYFAINTKPGRRILYSSRSTNYDPEVKSSKVKRSHGLKVAIVTRAATAVCCCCRRGSACRYDCLCFLVALCFIC